jgi:hypothetical protein
MGKPRPAFGRFVGPLETQWLDDGEHMRLSHAFTYVDPRGVKWPVKKGATINGASIPRYLWVVIGSPFTGLYRNASVPHDWYCDLRSRPWKQVHRMFYEAMMAAGTDANQAKAMYYGVYLGGPRWDEQAQANVQLALKEPPDAITRRLARGPADRNPPRIDTSAPAAGIERYDPFSPGRARVIGDVGGGPDGGGGAWRPTAVDEPAPDAFSKTVKSLGAMSLDDLEAAADSVRPPD